MHHYRRNISDWNDHTRHLSRVEKSVYQDLFELYLQTERPLPDDVGQLARRILASTKPEKDALKAVLSEFFTLKDGVYWHQGGQATIKKYREVAEKAKASADARWGADGMRAHSEGNANQKPETNNQKPETSFSLPAHAGKKKAAIPASEFFPVRGDEHVWFVNHALETTDAHKRRDLDIFELIQNFEDYHLANGTSKSDWRAAFRYWVREAIKRPPRGFIPPQGGNAA